uniref:Uncharacterized protein n=1 Tax=Romanomermis culicivorax TaxID=13658 RepID=A0A915J4T3_ROMCU
MLYIIGRPTVIVDDTRIVDLLESLTHRDGRTTGTISKITATLSLDCKIRVKLTPIDSIQCGNQEFNKIRNWLDTLSLLHLLNRNKITKKALQKIVLVRIMVPAIQFCKRLFDVALVMSSSLENLKKSENFDLDCYD